MTYTGSHYPPWTCRFLPDWCLCTIKNMLILKVVVNADINIVELRCFLLPRTTCGCILIEKRIWQLQITYSAPKSTQFSPYDDFIT